jgi:hypothetical protein
MCLSYPGRIAYGRIDRDGTLLTAWTNAAPLPHLGCEAAAHEQRLLRPPLQHARPSGSAGADRRTVGNLVIEARKFSGLAVDTLVELTRDNHADSTRYAAATALLDRGYGRPAQSLDLHLSADAITKRLSDMTDAELAALEQRMVAAAPIVIEAMAEGPDDGELPDGEVGGSPPSGNDN